MGVAKPWLATISPQARAAQLHAELSSLRVELASLSKTVPSEFQSVIQPLIDLIAESIDQGLTLSAGQGNNLTDAPDEVLERFGRAPIGIKDRLLSLANICGSTYCLYCHTLAVRQRLIRQ